ncbi:MAG: GIY-YIG nuclease family protein [Terriglobia bacterium]
MDAIGVGPFSPPAKQAVVRARGRATEAFPSQPGVYIFRNSEEQPIYVGKAKSLNHRVRSYFYQAGRCDIKLLHLLASARTVETIITNTEGEALNLENRLIKQMRPRYNVLLRDDKTYPYIKLAATGTGAEVTVTRRKDADDAIYYGPFCPASLAHQIVRIIRRYFLPASLVPFDTDCAVGKGSQCRKERLKAGANEAIRHETEKVRKVRRLLEGHIDDAVSDFSHRMILASDACRFEEAARYRYYLLILKQLQEHANAASIPEGDTDIIGTCRRGPWTAVAIFKFRAGGIVACYDLIAKSRGRSSHDELLRSLARWLHCSSSPVFPKIVAAVSLRHRKIMVEALSGAGRKGVRLQIPAAGPLRAWEDIANKNAQASLEGWIHGSRRQSSPTRCRNKAHYRVNEACPHGWRPVGPAEGCCRTHGGKRAAARSGPGQRRPFVAVRRRSYSCSTRSDFVPPLLPYNMPSSDSSSPRAENDTTFCLELTELNVIYVKPPDRGAMAR